MITHHNHTHMKLTHILGTLGIASAFMVAVPTTTLALDVTSTTKLYVEDSGNLHVSGAEVTSVSGNIINAVTRFKDSVVNMVITTNASTTIAANNSKTATTADIQTGDKLSISGMLTGFGSTISLTATKIRDITSMQYWRVKSGNITSVSPASNSFTITHGKINLVVQLTASTTIRLANDAAGTISGLKVGDRVKTSGLIRNDGSLLVASTVQVKDDGEAKRKGDKEDHKKDTERKNQRSFFFSSKNDVHLGDR